MQSKREVKSKTGKKVELQLKTFLCLSAAIKMGKKLVVVGVGDLSTGLMSLLNFDKAIGRY